MGASLPVKTKNDGDVVVGISGDNNGIKIAGGPGATATDPIFVSQVNIASLGEMKTSGNMISEAIQDGNFTYLQAQLIAYSKVATLQHVILSSSTTMRWDVQLVDAYGDVITELTVFTTGACPVYEFKPVVQGQFQIPYGDGANARFQVKVTNESGDGSSASAYATFFWSEQQT